MEEIEVLRPIWLGGEQVEAGTFGKLPRSEAVYLAGLGRVRIVEAEAEAEANTVSRKKK